MAAHQRSKMVAIGKIVAPQGKEGEVRLMAYFDTMDHIEPLTSVALSPLAEGSTFTVLTAREHGKFFVLKLEGCDSIGDAERLVGAEVLVPEESFRPLPEGEYYWHQVEGFSVYTDSGEFLGRVSDFFPTPGHEVLVVECEGREVLIPAVGEVIKAVELEERKLVIHPIRGLLDDDTL